MEKKKEKKKCMNALKQMINGDVMTVKKMIKKRKG